MNVSNFIAMGEFRINDVVILDHKTSFNGGGIFMTVSKDDEKQHFMGVAINNLNNFDIVNACREQKHITIVGGIFKNPKTEKVLFIVEDAKKQISIV